LKEIKEEGNEYDDDPDVEDIIDTILNFQMKLLLE
jgi:hypothetical protein